MRSPLHRQAKEPKIHTVQVALLHTTKGDTRDAILTRTTMPLEEMREHWGVRGYYVRYTLNWSYIMAIGMSVFFSAQTALLSFLTTHSMSGAIIPTSAAAGIGMAMGIVMGRMVSGQSRKGAPPDLYMGWAEWNPETQTNDLVPMEPERASQLTWTNKEQAAYLQIIGQAPARKPQDQTAHGQEDDEQDDVVQGSVPVYTSKGLYEALQVKTALRILTPPDSGERIAQMASLGGIAISLLAIAGLVGITVADQQPTPTTQTAISTPGPNQDVSNVR